MYNTFLFLPIHLKTTSKHNFWREWKSTFQSLICQVYKCLIALKNPHPVSILCKLHTQSNLSIENLASTDFVVFQINTSKKYPQ